MAARTATEAVRAVASAFQQALSCLTQGRFNVEGYRPIDLPYRAELQDGDPVAIGASSLRLRIVLRYRIVQAANPPGTWIVQLAAYDYEILDDSEREIVAYQWHPESRSPITWPHLHLGAGAGDLRS